MAEIPTTRMESLQTSQDYLNFYREGGLITNAPWVGIDENSCVPSDRKKPCDGFKLAGTHTVMTDKEGVSSLTVDAVLSWGKTVIDPPVRGKSPIFRDFNTDMEIGWDFVADSGAFNMERVSQKYWSKGWPTRTYVPAPESLEKPLAGDYKWIFENRQYECTLPSLEADKKDCVYDTKKAGKAAFEKLWKFDYGEQGEKMQRLVATRMFTSTEGGAAAYDWKMGDTKKWTAWFNANNMYRAESAVMDLQLADGEP